MRQDVTGNATSTVAPRHHDGLPIFGAASGNPHGRAKECRCLGGPLGSRKMRGQICGWIRIVDDADSNKIQKALTQRFMHGTDFRSQRRWHSEGYVGLTITAAEIIDAPWAVLARRCSTAAGSMVVVGGSGATASLGSPAAHPTIALRRLRAADAKLSAF